MEKLNTDTYPWLPIFIKNGEDEATDLVRNASNYVADVWKMVNYHIVMYENREKYKSTPDAQTDQ